MSGSDVPLDIELMVVEDLPLRLSFRSEAASRPRWASVGALRLGLDLAQLEDLALDLPGRVAAYLGLYDDTTVPYIAVREVLLRAPRPQGRTLCSLG